MAERVVRENQYGRDYQGYLKQRERMASLERVQPKPGQRREIVINGQVFEVTFDGT